MADLLLQKLQHLARQPQPFAVPMGMPAAPVQHYREEIPGLTQAKLCMLFTAGDNPNPPSVSILRVAMSVLGGSATSRLFRNVREKQSLCYYCGSAAQRATGVMMIDSGVEPGREEQAEAAILAEWEALKNGPITQEEVDDCRRGLLSGMDALGDSLAALESLGTTARSPGASRSIRRSTARCSPAPSRWTRCARPCRGYSYSVCYTVTAQTRHPWERRRRRCPITNDSPPPRPGPPQPSAVRRWCCPAA